MKRFHISISVGDYAAAVAEYSARLGCEPCVTKQGRYALWRTELLNFSISHKAEQPAGMVRHIGFEDNAESGFREEKDGVGIIWEYFSAEAQAKEIEDKIPDAVTVVQPKPIKASGAEVIFRFLETSDVGAFRALRLRGLKEEPSAFLECYEDALERPADAYLSYFNNGRIAGAFVDNALVGMVALFPMRGAKLRHKATIGGVYVAPEARGRGIARRLMIMVNHEAQEMGLEQLQLSTNTLNRVTITLYESLGFARSGREPHILKLADGSYVDDITMVKFLKPGS